jgi:hypothetical protein
VPEQNRRLHRTRQGRQDSEGWPEPNPNVEFPSLLIAWLARSDSVTTPATLPTLF